MALTDRWFREDEEEERRRKAEKAKQQATWNAVERPGLTLPPRNKMRTSEPVSRGIAQKEYTYFKQRAADEQVRRTTLRKEGVRPLQEYQRLANRMGEDKLADRIRSVDSLWRSYMNETADKRIIWELVNSNYEMREIEQMMRRAARAVNGDAPPGKEYMVSRGWMVERDLDPQDPVQAALAAYTIRRQKPEPQLYDPRNLIDDITGVVGFIRKQSQMVNPLAPSKDAMLVGRELFDLFRNRAADDETVGDEVAASGERLSG